MFFDYHPKLVTRIVEETPKTIIGLIVLSVIFLLIYQDYVPTVLLLIWVVLQVLFIYARHLNSKRLAASIKENNHKKMRYQIKIFFGLLVYSAFIWNLGAIVGVMYAQAPYEFISLALIMGLLTAGTMTLSSILSGYILYFFLMLLPQLYIISTYSNSVHKAILLLSVIYIPYILMLAKSINENLLNHIKDNETLEANVKKLHKLSITDTLTEVHNRRYFFEVGQRMMDLSQREDKTISLLMLDIDYFKMINDTYGHQAGDAVLVDLAHEIEEMTRKSDLFARIGGEEFAILLYDASITDAKKIAQNICNAVSKQIFTYDSSVLEVTLSIGVAETDKTVYTLDTLYHEADLRLYMAKESGRNCVR